MMFNTHLSRREYHSQFCAKFNRGDVSVVALEAKRQSKGWMTGRTGKFEKGQEPPNKGKRCPPGKGGNSVAARKTQFKKGQLPPNAHALGYEHIDTDGYVQIRDNTPEELKPSIMALAKLRAMIRAMK